MPWAFSILPPIEVHLLQRRSQDFQRGDTLCQTEGTHHLNIVGCFLKKKVYKWGVKGTPGSPPPLP